MYLSPELYSACHYQPFVEFGVIRRDGSKTLILANKQVDTLAGCLPAISDYISFRGDLVIIKWRKSNFHLHTPSSHVSAGLYIGTEYISLTQPGVECLVRLFQVVQEH